MARKKAEVTEVTEEIQNAEPIVETTPEVEATEEVVEEKPKRGRKKKVEEPVEEVKVEEPIAEKIPEVKEEPVVESEPIVEGVKEELIAVEEPQHEIKAEEPIVEEKSVKKTKAKKSEPVEEVKIEETKPTGVYVGRITLPKTQSRKGPGLAFPIARDLYKGNIVHISEVDGNWGKISQNTWININYVDKI